MTRHYAAFMNLEHRRCVVVGGGAVAERKVGSLQAAGASTVIIAPTVSDGIRAAAEDGALSWTERAYRRGDLNGALLAFAATNDRAVNADVVTDARMAGVLVNSVDDPRAGDFIVPATVRRGDVSVAVSTGGRSPSFARQLREELEAWLTPARVQLLDELGEVRRQLQASGRSPGPEAWRRVASSELLDDIERGDLLAVRRRLLDTLVQGSSSVQHGPELNAGRTLD